MSNTINSHLENLTADKLREIASLVVNDYRDGTDLVFQAVLNALEAKLPEAEFVKFCEGLG